MAEKEYLSREDVIGVIDAIWQANKNGSHGDPILYDALDTVARVIEVFPAADVAPIVHGHIIWRERHKGGFITRKCLSDCGNSIFTPSCNKTAKIDDRCTVSLPYCSVCDKLLGDFLNYCPNCGAKMDGDENEP